MPIEIRELIIKATVTQDSGNAGGTSATSSPNSNNVSATEEIIDTCVEKILEILKKKNER